MSGPAPILPGAAIGILGAGQLGRMLAMAARRSGYRVHVIAPGAGQAPAGQVADRVHDAEPTAELLSSLADEVSVLTYEFENLPRAAVEAAAERLPVRPSPRALATTQHRILEKTFLREHGLPVVPFEAVHGPEEAAAAVARIGAPAVIKSAGLGYDGKGQARVESADEVSAAWSAVGADEAVVEACVDLAMEVSVVAARGVDGSFAHYGVTENRHRHHILDLSIGDAELDPAVCRQAVEIARAVGEGLDAVGTYCVEFFIDGAGRLMVNEIAPRPHNSGHLTIEGAATSQFDQQLRAICGLPLGSTRRLAPAAMVNLLGDVWDAGTPPWAEVYQEPTATLHLYGKGAPSPGRKMGHITVLGEDRQEAAERALNLRNRLAPHVVS
ncbi:5-(carboxyamino)imidazole ribonucleotide synthase [Halorhodospira halophila]|uniref:N5-carboxyaminoimidazole ribonucleotide synthase n=1 Tax=Halorhodospira halophila (strain DSM 244 / SL1) TaxID=349124 RepID=A1WYS2_HALHL|nr:5-(carboxyamino)imidazole ribonucleotide synthase [Halorhodospira halophila]ABM62834.1 5-(carboxyamino)imidazole ribonucleotide synthase [Halorhodospira halophila SL1]MBK1728043.1 5-(carboxyamino)imidazole ribonucleotide synthase [Halorhodospira halophila]